MDDITLRRILVLDGKTLVCELVCGPPAWWSVQCPGWQSEPTASLLLSAKQMGSEIAAGGLARIVLGTRDSEQDIEVRLLAERSPLSLFAIVSRTAPTTSVAAVESRGSGLQPVLAHITSTFSRLAGTASVDELRAALSSGLERP